VRHRGRDGSDDGGSEDRHEGEPAGDGPTEAAAIQAAEERLRERLTQQIAQQWGQVRGGRPAHEPGYRTGPSNLRPAQVPWAYDLAAAWAWRFIVIAVATLMVLYGISTLAVIVFPVVIALFIAALTAPVVAGLERIGLPRKLAAFVVVLGGIAVIALLLAFVTQQIASGSGELASKVSDGLGQIESWLHHGPLHASDSQINTWITKAQDYVNQQGTDLASKATEIGVAASHILAGFFIILFSTYFFLADGNVIWDWVVRIFPRGARSRADSSGRVAWRSLTQFARATVLVAATDAAGIMIIAAILKVPLVTVIGVLVFIGAFVPLVGAFVSGGVAVLVALVAHGPIVALVMLGGVVLIQQIEAHVLQPFLMGRFVSVHPLGVILAIGTGVVVAGIAGALVAVPLAAALNAVVLHLATFVEPEPEPEPQPEPGPGVEPEGDPA
jgi:predicted PurR-regulated permease PerM